MPVHTNSIGEYQFLQMDGSIYLRQQQLELIERDGVNGTGVRKLGLRGKPFQLVTTNYEETFATAHTKMLAYKLLVGDDPVTLTYKSIDKGTFLVLGVVESDCFAIFNSIGGLVGGEECCQIVTWMLLG